MAELKECPICKEELTDVNISVSDCNHKFHFKCLHEWIEKSNSCPMCRNPLVKKAEEPIWILHPWGEVRLATEDDIDDLYEIHGVVCRPPHLIRAIPNAANAPAAPVVPAALVNNRTYADVVAGSKHK